MNRQTLHSARHCLIGIIAGLSVMPGAVGDDDRATAVPSNSVKEMLQRFVAECVLITPGAGEFPKATFVGEDKPAKNEVAKRQVTLNTAFRISQFEMTQELYAAITGNNPSRWRGLRNSVERVTFKDASNFCQLLTAELKKRDLIEANQVVRLPTSVEWEYCCRAGTTTRYGFGDIAGEGGSTAVLDQYAWHTGNAAGNDPAVGVLKGNPWKLHDMHGYLWEFVDDSSLPRFTPSPENTVVIRGGSWRDAYPLLSCATYLMVPSPESGDHIGFRCVIAANPSVKNGAKR